MEEEEPLTGHASASTSPGDPVPWGWGLTGRGRAGLGVLALLAERLLEKTLTGAWRRRHQSAQLATCLGRAGGMTRKCPLPSACSFGQAGQAMGCLEDASQGPCRPHDLPMPADPAHATPRSSRPVHPCGELPLCSPAAWASLGPDGERR